MHEVVPGARAEGRVMLGGRDIYTKDTDPVMIRRRVGMVFQKPNPFSKSIYDNVAWGARINGYRGDMDELVERSLRQAALWDEVKDKLKKSGLDLSGGQQQRLCIARTLAVEPEVIRSHLLPMALPGALTGTILALSRAIGETAPLIVVGAATYLTFAPDGPLSQYSALPIQIYYWVSQPQEEFKVALAAAGIVVLMAVLILTNSFAIWLRNRYQRRG